MKNINDYSAIISFTILSKMLTPIPLTTSFSAKNSSTNLPIIILEFSVPITCFIELGTTFCKSNFFASSFVFNLSSSVRKGDGPAQVPFSQNEFVKLSIIDVTFSSVDNVSIYVKKEVLITSVYDLLTTSLN